jgi:hypothetical protein
MAAAWSFSRGGSQGQEPLTRLVSTLSLDGDRISAELTVRFHRAVSSSGADSVADEFARLVAEVLGEQITQGELPLTKDDLLSRVRLRLSLVASKAADAEIESLHLVQTNAAAGRSAYRTRQGSPGAPPQREARGSGSMSAVRPSSQSSSFPAPARVPATFPRTLWPTALTSVRAGASVEQIGSLLGPPLRDSVGTALLSSFAALDPAVVDRLALLDGVGPIAETRREVCACFATAAYRIFLSSQVDQKTSSELVKTAVVRALPAESFPSRQISRYIASESPVRDLATQMATFLKSEEAAPAIHGALSPLCEALRFDLLGVATQVRRIRNGE